VSSVIPRTYEGREQALVKHTLLKSYLEKLVLIIGAGARSSGRVEICYVDCFAGPWGAPTDDLDGTSIALSLKTLEECRRQLAKLGVTATVRALYIEKNADAFGRLSGFLHQSAPKTVQHHCLHGDFVDLRSQILEWCSSTGFTFFFIDPKGWKDIGVETLRPLLLRPRSEFLINFAYNFINRTASMAEWQDAMLKLLGGSVELNGLRPAEREEALVNAYRQNLKKCIVARSGEYRPRTAYVSVLDPLRQRTKYHLVYLTTHPKGIVEFMHISEQVDIVQRRVRSAKQSDIHQERSGMEDMFRDNVPSRFDDGHCNPEEVDQFWLKRLSTGEQEIGSAEFADILENTNWLPGELQSSLVRLMKTGKVENVTADASRRRKRPLHFEKRERLRLKP
jgi:three-Cys-motif partner protein